MTVLDSDKKTLEVKHQSAFRDTSEMQGCQEIFVSVRLPTKLEPKSWQVKTTRQSVVWRPHDSDRNASNKSTTFDGVLHDS